MSVFRAEFLAAWRTRGAMGDPPFRHQFPPLLGAATGEREPTRHEERLSAIAFVQRREPRAYRAADLADFQRCRVAVVCKRLHLSRLQLHRRRLRFWLALQTHMCQDGCPACHEGCRRP